MSDIIEKELSYILNGCIFDVHNEVGPGLREECYQKATEIRLAHAGVPFIAKQHTRSELIWFGEVADVFEPDAVASNRVVLSPITPLLLDKSILVQVEAIHDGVSLRAIRTMQTHLACMNAEIGVIASFGQSLFELRGVKRRFEPG